MAEQLIESLSADFEPSKYHDTYREELLDLIDQKASGATPVLEAPADVSDDVVVDIMAALEKSVEQARANRGNKSGSAGSDGAGPDGAGSDDVGSDDVGSADAAAEAG